MNIDIFDSMKNAAMTSAGNYMDEGTYVVAPKVIKLKEGYKGKSFIHEFEVLETSNPEKHPVGSSGSWVVKLDRQQAWGDIKGFMLAIACEVDPQNVKDPPADAELHAAATDFAKAAIDPAYATKIGAEPGFLIGKPVRLECIKKPTTTANAKSPFFTVHKWSPYTAEEAAA